MIAQLRNSDRAGQGRWIKRLANLLCASGVFTGGVGLALLIVAQPGRPAEQSFHRGN